MHSPFTVDVPDINPDFSAPFFQGLQVIASYILAGAMIVVFIMLVVAGAALSFRGLASDRVRTWAGENILWIFIAAAVLGAANGLLPGSSISTSGSDVPKAHNHRGSPPRAPGRSVRAGPCPRSHS